MFPGIGTAGQVPISLPVSLSAKFCLLAQFLFFEDPAGMANLGGMVLARSVGRRSHPKHPKNLAGPLKFCPCPDDGRGVRQKTHEVKGIV